MARNILHNNDIIFFCSTFDLAMHEISTAYRREICYHSIAILIALSSINSTALSRCILISIKIALFQTCPTPHKCLHYNHIIPVNLNNAVSLIGQLAFHPVITIMYRVIAAAYPRPSNCRYKTQTRTNIHGQTNTRILKIIRKAIRARIVRAFPPFLYHLAFRMAARWKNCNTAGTTGCMCSWMRRNFSPGGLAGAVFSVFLRMYIV